MLIQFTQNVAIVDSMIFEDCYEEGLRMDFEEKKDIIFKGVNFVVWMFVDKQLAGEAYGVRLSNMDEEIEDCSDLPGNVIYCYSTTILPQFRELGLGAILKSHWLGMCRNRTNLVVGHSTSSIMKRINENFGAVHSTEHENWYGTRRRAWFYKLEL